MYIIATFTAWKGMVSGEKNSDPEPELDGLLGWNFALEHRPQVRVQDRVSFSAVTIPFPTIQAVKVATYTQVPTVYCIGYRKT